MRVPRLIVMLLALKRRSAESSSMMRVPSTVNYPKLRLFLSTKTVFPFGDYKLVVHNNGVSSSTDDITVSVKF